MSDGVIACHHPLLLDAQDICQRCRICERHERALCDLWRSGKTRVVGGKIHLAQEAIGNIDLRDAGKLELLWQPFLQRAEHAVRAPTCFRRIGRDMLDSKLIERPAHLRPAPVRGIKPDNSRAT
jgi:hypothetical protein